MSDFTILASIVTDDSIILTQSNGRPFIVPSSDKNFQAAKTALNEWDMDTLEEIVNASAKIEARYATAKGVEVFNGHITVGGIVVKSYLVDRILRGVRKDEDVDPLLAFLENVMKNPSYRATQDLYPFLEASGLPITEDGHFLAYKGVRDNYTDFHTGKMDNSVGKIVEMPRNNVDEDPNRTCSSGLHACGAAYLGKGYGFGRGRILLLKINPADVVAFPTDYDSQKLRACRYEVLMDVTGDAGEDFTDFLRDNNTVNGTNLY